ncbi:MAG TPA: pitrilysin family protein [Candidatus Acidoferrales bacterium]|nr:pitrilysin family protein [Candidatus Acidoferrales bacterium]
MRRTVFRKSLFGFLVLCGLCVLALGARLIAADVDGIAVPKLELHDTHLDNGLRVILVPDHSAPVYAINVTYNVGSRNEPPGHTGYAHLFEHMMFQGSENVGKGEHFILIFNNGGGMNGTTNEDRTNYFEELPKNQLDLGLYLEADRMRSLAVTQPNLDNQRAVVEEERRQSVDNQPYGHADLDIDNLSYDNFAYKHSTIGSMQDLNNASLQDVQNFFKTYYAPDNGVLVLVGDFDPEEALAKVKKYFDAIPSQQPPPKVDLSEEQHYGERRETIYDPLAREPQIIEAYHIPPGNTAENYAAQALAGILSGGQSSRFYQHLVKEKQLAVNVQAEPDARIGPSLFYIVATPRPGVSVADLEKGIDDELAAVIKDGVTADELAKAKTQELRRFIDQRRSTLNTANLIGQYAVYYDDPNLINTVADKEAAVTLDDVHAVATKYFVRDERAVVITMPAPKDSVAGKATGGAQ